jgi:RNA polymerase sigma-70 factor (ECF subfamily)
LKKVYGLGQREIAAYMGISESTVEKHVAKGLMLCAQFMDDEESIRSESVTAHNRGEAWESR